MSALVSMLLCWRVTKGFSYLAKRDPRGHARMQGHVKGPSSASAVCCSWACMDASRQQTLELEDFRFTRAPNPGTCYIYLQWGFLLNAHWIVMDRDGYWTDSADTGHVACKRHGWSDTGRKMKNGCGGENALTCWFVPFTTFQCQCLKCPLVDFWMS